MKVVNLFYLIFCSYESKTFYFISIDLTASIDKGSEEVLKKN